MPRILETIQALIVPVIGRGQPVDVRSIAADVARLHPDIGIEAICEMVATESLAAKGTCFWRGQKLGN